MTWLESIVNSWYGPILGFVLGLIPLIIIHEVGHFVMAKIIGVWVLEFGVGYPPRILKLFKWKETDFTLNWLPLGGFARMEGEQTFSRDDDPSAATVSQEDTATNPYLPKRSPEEKVEARKHSLYSKGPFQRIAIYLGGPLMNMITAWLIAVMIFTTGVPTVETVISEVQPNTPASEAGMLAGDVIISVGGVAIEDTSQVSTEARKHAGEDVALTLRRDGAEMDVVAYARENPPEGQGTFGITITGQEVPGSTERYSLGEALSYGSAYFARVTLFTVTMPFQIAKLGLTFQEARPVGVIGISQVAQHSMSQSIDQSTAFPFLSMLLMISISLGVFNLLPIPALDGGRILFSLIEKLRGKPLSPALEERIHMIALAVMMILFIGITALDIINPVQLP